MKKQDRVLTPQQEAFLSYYTDPKSETFGNATQSAKKAKYSDEYAETITAQLPDWLSENLGDMKMVKKAEKRLDNTLDYEPVSDEGKIDVALLRVQTDVAKFVAERLNKNKYSARGEFTGAGGKDLIPETLSKEEKEKLLKLLD